MLSNEKYIGDALLQKTYTVDFLTKKRVKNEGIVPQYYVENSHQGIIPKDLFMQVQEEMIRRANMKAGKKKRVYSSKYALSSLVFCPKCGDIYRRVAWNNRGKHSIVWRCCSRVQGGYKKRITELEEFLQGIDFELTQYDEQLVRSYIQKITVYNGRYEVEFKAGIKLDIENKY